MNLSLKLQIISTSVILLLAVIFPLFGQENGGSSVRISQSPYRIGERLTYNVSFSNIPSAAHVEVHVVSRGTYFGRDAIQLRAHVETTGVVNVALFSINNDYTTYIDPETGLPFRSQEVARDATRATDSFEDFTQPGGNEAIPPKQKAFPGTYDLLSVFYRARTLPLAEGAVYNFRLRGSSGDYQAEMKVVGRQVVRTNVGSFNAIVAQLRASNSPVKNLKVYLSDDEGHVPVLVTGRVSPGELRIELAGSELLKPPTGIASPTPPVAIAATPTSTPVATLPSTAAVANEDWPFSVNEQLNYQVFIGGSNTPLGVATFQVRGRSRYFDRDGLLLTVKAQTTGAAARLFVANDQIDSYVDPKALLPYRTVLKLAEGKRRLNQTLVVNQERGIATTDKGTRIDIPVGTHDYLSFFYAVRTFSLNPPKRSAISILVENKPKTLFISSLKRESIQLGERKISAIPLLLTTDDPESDKYQLRMWVSDDKRRLPLRVTCKTELGPLRADLAILPTASQ